MPIDIPLRTLWLWLSVAGVTGGLLHESAEKDKLNTLSMA
jgi:hypothetical protein